MSYADALQSGFRAHGDKAIITGDPYASADIHVVLGPHYAKRQWLGAPCILLDRCYYRGDPEHVSIGWMTETGGRVFEVGEGREPPTPKPLKTGSRSIFLADYQGEIEPADTIRKHPADQEPTCSLVEALQAHDIAIGYKTTALVTAALEGLQVVCRSPDNIMSEPNWLDLLPYADWSYDEIYSGEAWQHLKRSLNQQLNQSRLTN